MEFTKAKEKHPEDAKRLLRVFYFIPANLVDYAKDKIIIQIPVFTLSLNRIQYMN